MSRPAEELLEFDRLKDIVSRSTTCVPGRRAIEALVPQQDVASLDAEFELVREAIAYLRAGSELGFGSLADPDAWLARLGMPGSVLVPAELLDVASLAENADAVRQTFKTEAAKYPRLAERAAALADFRPLLTAIRRAVLPSGEISDDASPQLKRIRASMIQARVTIRHSLEKILRARGEPAGEDYVTLRNERFVIPVRASDRRGVPGVVHAASATGQTVFVEPLEAIDLNNRLVQLGEDETSEIARILDELTNRVRAERGPLEAAAASIAHLDSIFARARFAREFDCVVPEFTSGNSLRLEAARNPVLEATLRPQGRKAVPMSSRAGRRRDGDGRQRAEHRRQDGIAEDRRTRGAFRAIGNSRGGGARRDARLRPRPRGYRRRAVHRRGPFDIFGAHVESEVDAGNRDGPFADSRG